jgi:mannose-6-phosphate isomerase-like protein (cupin superfamily)
MRRQGTEQLMSEYSHSIVRKPWGYEYLMYESDRIGIWYLHIMQNRQTSLHCHPTKKTGYILLSGEAEVTFLNDSKRLNAVSKLMLREGLFHSTKALSEDGIHVIEVESPPDKTNLVRLDDEYGRKELPYEDGEAIVPMTDNCITFAPPLVDKPLSYIVHGTKLTIETIKDVSMLNSRQPEDIILVMDGGLISKTNEPIVSPGDVVTISTFNRLAETFAAPKGVTLMTVSMEDKGVNDGK